ncbi:MAG TPA: ATP-binding protein [Stellaceae bacterium]|nr:ATP-binding protein [Stellaceae bacterium]
MPHVAILTWVGLFAAFSTIQLRRWWLRRDWPPPLRVGRGALVRATIWSFLAGSLWGIAVVYAFPWDSLPHQLFLAFVVGGVCAGAVASMTMQPVACIAYLAPAAIPIFVLFALVEGEPVIHAMAAMYAFFFLGLVVVIANGYAAFVDTVQTKVRNVTLTAGLAEASSANRAKSDFLAHMSHELRTPLNAILGFAEMIRDERLGPEASAKYRIYAHDIFEAGQHLLLIVNDVLDISKIEVGRLALRDDMVDVGAVVSVATAFVEQRAKTAGIAIESQVPEDLPVLIADELRVKQILINLLTNSIKFTHENGNVAVGAGVRADGSLAIWVIDTGAGMTKSEITVALQPYRQVDNLLTRRNGGAGLGLPLSRALVELHGGRLVIDSTPDVGTSVTAIFPATRVRRREPFRSSYPSQPA